MSDGIGRFFTAIGLRSAKTGEEPRSYRLSSSVRLPWAFGLAALLVLALIVGLFVGKIDPTQLRVPGAVLAYQEGVTQASAQSVRRGVNEGVYDLVQFASDMTVTGRVSAPQLTEALTAFSQVHGRYLSVYVLDSDNKVVASVGAAPVPSLLDPAPPYDTAGMMDAVRGADGEGEVIQQYSPILLTNDEKGTLVGVYDPTFLTNPLMSAAPGEAWVVNSNGLAIGSLTGQKGFETLPRSTLRDAAGKSSTGETGAFVVAGGLDQQEVVGYAPVSGVGPAGQVRWAVVTSRSVASLSLPATQARHQGLLAGVVLAIITLLTFGWMYVVVLNPLFRLQGEAERLAFGDLSKSVEIIRYDEVGLIARSLERLRILLIRKRVQGNADKES